MFKNVSNTVKKLMNKTSNSVQNAFTEGYLIELRQVPFIDVVIKFTSGKGFSPANALCLHTQYVKVKNQVAQRNDSIFRIPVRLNLF